MDQAETIRRSRKRYADNTAVWCDGRSLTYRRLFDRACRLANALGALGVRPLEPVAVLSNNALELVEQAAGCALGNYPRATLYTYHAPEVNRHLLEITSARALIVQAAFWPDLAPLLGALPHLRAVLVFGDDGRGVPVDAPGPIEVHHYEHCLDGADPDDPRVPNRPDDPHLIRFSSGTTGKPKAIYHSIDRWARTTGEWRWVTPMMTEQTRYLTPIALAHLGVALLWDTLSVGAAVVPMPVFDAARALDLIERHRVTHLTAAPVMIRGMLDALDGLERDLSSLECVLYAGSPIATETMRRAIDAFGPTLHQLYAQSEALPATMLLPHQHVLAGTDAEMCRLRSVGRPTPNTRITIRDGEGHELPTGEIGEITVQSPFTMSGLWNDPAGTAERVLADGGVLTRDMGYLDADGFVYLVDRKDDMIVSGGYNIWPAELEHALDTHPAVLEAAVFGIPDPRWGETPKAAVVLHAGATATADELIAHTRGVVGGIKKITSVDFHPALPRTATGKIERGQLKDPYWSGHDTRIAGS